MSCVCRIDCFKYLVLTSLYFSSRDLSSFLLHCRATPNQPLLSWPCCTAEPHSISTTVIHEYSLLCRRQCVCNSGATKSCGTTCSSDSIELCVPPCRSRSSCSKLLTCGRVRPGACGRVSTSLEFTATCRIIFVTSLAFSR